MNRLIFALGGAAAVVVVAFVALGLYFNQPGIGAPPSPPPSPAPTPEASVAEPSTPADGSLPEGSHVLWVAPGGTAITVTIPAIGWYGESGGILAKNDNPDAPDGAGMIVFAGDLYVYEHPCQWESSLPDAPSTTVDELVAALASQPSRDASEPVDITVDGYPGKSITLHVPDDAVFSECDRGEFRTLVDDPQLDGARYHQDPGQIDQLWIVDVNGVPILIDAAYYAGTPAEHVDEMRAIIDSITFDE